MKIINCAHKINNKFVSRKLCSAFAKVINCRSIAVIRLKPDVHGKVQCVQAVS